MKDENIEQNKTKKAESPKKKEEGSKTYQTLEIIHINGLNET